MNERIDAFLAYLTSERSVSSNTLSAYRNDLTQFAGFLDAEAKRSGVGPLAISGIDRERVLGYFLFLRERGYAPASVARKLAALRTFFYYLWRKGEITGNPTLGVLTPDVKKAAPRSIGAEDVRQIIETANLRESPEARRDDAMLRLLYGTGMRVSELVGLDVGDLALGEATVRVVGRAGRVRSLPLDPSLVSSVERYLGAARPSLARDGQDQAALFLNHRGQRLTRQGFWLIMKALVKACGVSGVVTPHTLRHSFATHRLDEGVALGQLQQLLGHASISTTQLYTFTTKPAADEATSSNVPLLDSPPIPASTGRNGRATRDLVGARG